MSFESGRKSLSVLSKGDKLYPGKAVEFVDICK